MFQQAFDDLERELRAVLDEAGYQSRTLVLRVSLNPREGWHFECLVAQYAHAPLRRSLAQANDADELLRQLRAKLNISQLQLL